MSDTHADIQFWQTVAAVIGSGLGAFAVYVGRRAGGLARRAPEPAVSGDALQRQILEGIRKGNDATLALAEEMRGLRSDWQAKRDTDEARRRDRRDGLDERLDDIGHALSIARRGNNEVKLLLREMLDRFPFRAAPPDREPEEG